jgi:hypothetical protein
MTTREFLKYALGGFSAAKISKAFQPRPEVPAKVEPIQPAALGSVDEHYAHTGIFIPSKMLVLYGRKYDRVRFPAGIMPANFRMFQTPIGQSCPYTHEEKWRDFTNMDMAGCLPMPQAFSVQRIHFLVDSQITPQDYHTIMEYGWQFQLGERYYGSGTLMADAKLAQLASEIEAATRPVEDIEAFLKGNRPAPARETFVLEDVPLVIESGMFFAMNFESKSRHLLEEGADLLVMLEGFHALGVQ